MMHTVFDYDIVDQRLLDMITLCVHALVYYPKIVTWASDVETRLEEMWKSVRTYIASSDRVALTTLPPCSLLLAPCWLLQDSIDPCPVLTRLVS